MKPLSAAFANEARLYMRNHPGTPITIHQVGEIFGKAYTAGCTSMSMVNGFVKTGIFPMNEAKFNGMYAAASVTSGETFVK